jgi:hypothetical protein
MTQSARTAMAQASGLSKSVPADEAVERPGEPLRWPRIERTARYVAETISRG